LKKHGSRWILFLFSICCFAGILLLDGSLAFAQEAMSTGRKVWNIIMLFFNFGILVFVFVKYARKPLVSFLKNMCLKIEESLNTANHQLREAQARLMQRRQSLTLLRSTWKSFITESSRSRRLKKRASSNMEGFQRKE
jgi:F0F1-type ATP synthase membrane subunit b/b'